MALGDVLAKLGSGNTLSQAEVEQLRSGLNRAQAVAALVGGWVPIGTTPSFDVVNIGDGVITRSLTANAGSAEAIRLEADGDAFFGSNLAAPATTSLVIFSNAQTYNGEAMGAGDILFGDNTASKANILWDASAGQILFRGGVTTQGYIDVDGSAVFGAGNVTLDANGIQIVTPATYSTPCSLIWKSGPTNPAYGSWFRLACRAPGSAGGKTAYTVFETVGDDGKGAYCQFLTRESLSAGAEQAIIVADARAGLYTMLEFSAGVSGGTFNTATLNKTSTTFNDTGIDADFVVEGDTDANLLFVDAGADKVGIGDAAPGEKLDVAGNINATGVIKIDDVQVVSNRVVDARCDDATEAAFDALYPTTAGLIDALRDCLLAHGLLSAS